MSPINILSKSRGQANLMARIGTIFLRFGITPRKYENLLTKFSQKAIDLGCIPTFPITAVTLKRHPKVIRSLSRQGIEFAVHGYIHTDHGVLSLNEQMRHFNKAVETFNKCEVPFTGFRAPFVRTNEGTMEALNRLGFRYDSSFVVDWGVLENTKLNGWKEYERILDFYNAQSTSECFVLPRIINGCIEIPVSMPDDEIMVERLGITGDQETSDVWLKILQKSYDSGELFTVQLHPERFLIFETALSNVITQAKQYEEDVWITTLGEIADWWRERSEFTLKVVTVSDGKHRLEAIGSERATLLVKNVEIDTHSEDGLDGYRAATPGTYVLQSVKRPVIGVDDIAPAQAVAFLENEGYIVEKGVNPADCGLFLDGLDGFRDTDEKELYRRIEDSGAPLVKWWRWPDGARSALTVTGDIDSLTLQDFALRVYENWRQDKINRNGS